MTPSAAAWFSLPATEFMELVSVILVTDGMGKYTVRCVLLLRTTIFITCSPSLKELFCCLRYV